MSGRGGAGPVEDQVALVELGDEFTPSSSATGTVAASIRIASVTGMGRNGPSSPSARRPPSPSGRGRSPAPPYRGGGGMRPAPGSRSARGGAIRVARRSTSRPSAGTSSPRRPRQHQRQVDQGDDSDAVDDGAAHLQRRPSHHVDGALVRTRVRKRPTQFSMTITALSTIRPKSIAPGSSGCRRRRSTP